MQGFPTQLLLFLAVARAIGLAAAHGRHHKPWWSHHYEGVKDFQQKISKKVFDDVTGTWQDFRSTYLDGSQKCEKTLKAKLKTLEQKVHDFEKCKRKQKAAEEKVHRLERQQRDVDRYASECEAEQSEFHAQHEQELLDARAQHAAARKELETEVRRQENMKMLLQRDLDQERAVATQLRQNLQTANDARLLLGKRLADELAKADLTGQVTQDPGEGAVARMEVLIQDFEDLAESMHRRHDTQCEARPQAAAATVELEAERVRSMADLSRMTADLERASQDAAELRAQLDAAKQKITGLELVMLLSPSGQESAGVPSTRLACYVALTTVLSVLCLLLANKVAGLENKTRCEEAKTLKVVAEVERLREELDSEFGEMLKVDGQTHDANGKFPYHIYDEKDQHRTTRSIKVQCPGVRHCDVEVQIVFNGCILTIKRPGSPGVEAATWRQRFQFRPSDGLFEFKEDQTILEHGILQLVFGAYTHQSRTFRFPQHFDLAGLDFDGNWTLTPRGSEPQGELPQEVEDATQEEPRGNPTSAPFDAELAPVGAMPSAESTTVAPLPSSEAQIEKYAMDQGDENLDGEEDKAEAEEDSVEEGEEDDDGTEEDSATESAEVDSDDGADPEIDMAQATQLDKFAMEEAVPLLPSAAEEESEEERGVAAAAAAAASSAGSATSSLLLGPPPPPPLASSSTFAPASSFGAASFERLVLSRSRREDEAGSEASSSSCASFEKVQADAY